MTTARGRRATDDDAVEDKVLVEDEEARRRMGAPARTDFAFRFALAGRFTRTRSI
jgi:hypothetical protein